MRKMENALRCAGYETVNIDYPSTRFPVEELAELVLAEIEDRVGDAARVHFVTHSMGGILVRYINEHLEFSRTDRVVMLCPPNKGSEIVDRLGGFRFFEWWNGPAGLQLGTSGDGLIAGLGSIEFELGVLTGDRSINWILSLMIPGPNDGKVSIESARLSGMADYKVVQATHSYIMKNRTVIKDVLAFLETGKFSDS